jgi:two-component system, sensor histidine kinase RegB
VPALTTDQVEARAQVSLAWLLRLRWGAVVGQAVTIGVALVVLRAPLPIQRLVLLVLALVASNVVVWVARRFIPAPLALCGAALVFDALQLTGLLHAAGGAANPFSILYLVYIALAAVVLGARWTWSLATLCIGCYGLLFVSYVPLEHVGHMDAGMRVHLQGMWAAFCVAAVLTAYFVVQLSGAIERRDAEMAAMRERAARSERLASLATLAAGAAHELGTPLATIAVAASELQRSLEALPGGAAPGLSEDAALIRVELARCRAILDRMAADVGQGPGEAPSEFGVQELVAEALASVAPRDRTRVDSSTSGSPRARAPRAAVLRVLRNLLDNALAAARTQVRLRAHADRGGLQFVLEDDGPGMPAEVLRRAGEPFFSTKGPGAGLGLGLFIARSLCEQMGGRLRLDSVPGRGTIARVELPGAAAPPEASGA